MTPPDNATHRSSESSGAVDSAYRHIRGLIIRGELSSGEVLLESPLAERIGVSRTPVREALSRLANEGLVVLGRYRRAQVASFSMADVAEVFRLRGKLEGHAARRACLRTTAADILRADPAFHQWARAKSPDTFGPVGPCIVPELPADARVRVLLNGRERQNYPVSDMILSPVRIVALLSREMTLEPGDLIACGTSLGATAMRPGMTVEVVIDGIGTLGNVFAPTEPQP